MTGVEMFRWSEHALNAIFSIDKRSVLVHTEAYGSYSGKAMYIYWSPSKALFLKVSWDWGSCDYCDPYENQSSKEIDDIFKEKVKQLTWDIILLSQNEKKSSFNERMKWPIPYTEPEWVDVCRKWYLKELSLMKPLDLLECIFKLKDELAELKLRVQKLESRE